MTDPVSTALTVVGKGASSAITPKLREMLLGPVFKAYGNHWGEEAEERLRERRAERRERNAEKHLTALATIPFRRSFEDVSEDPAFDEWVAGASAIDPEVDPDLADFWRAALVSMAQGEASRMRLLRIVKSLGPDDAVFLASGHRRGRLFRPARQFQARSDYPKRLRAAGVFLEFADVIRRNQRFTLVFTSSFLICLVVYFTGDAWLLPNEEIQKLKAAILSLLCLFIVVPLLYFARFQLRSGWELSYDGASLMDHLAMLRAAGPRETAVSAEEPEAQPEESTPKTKRRPRVSKALNAKEG